MSERWKMNRIGFVNFWVYKDDSLNELKIPEFKIEDMKKTYLQNY